MLSWAPVQPGVEEAEGRPHGGLQVLTGRRGTVLTQGNSMEQCQGESNRVLGKVSSPESGQVLAQAPRGSGYELHLRIMSKIAGYNRKDLIPRFNFHIATRHSVPPAIQCTPVGAGTSPFPFSCFITKHTTQGCMISLMYSSLVWEKTRAVLRNRAITWVVRLRAEFLCFYK